MDSKNECEFQDAAELIHEFYHNYQSDIFI